MLLSRSTEILRTLAFPLFDCSDLIDVQLFFLQQVNKDVSKEHEHFYQLEIGEIYMDCWVIVWLDYVCR